MSDLTIVYLKDPNLNPAYFAEFKACLEDSPFSYIELPAIAGDIQAARVAGYQIVNSEYVLFVDPDDLVDLEVVAQALIQMQQDPELVLYAIRSDELYTLPNGEQRRKPSGDNLTTHLHFSPLNMHAANLYRTQVVKSVLPLLTQQNYVLFEWALRLVVSQRGKVGLTDAVGYTWRIHAGGNHHLPAPQPGKVAPRATVRSLIKAGLYDVSRPLRRYQP